MIIARIRRRDAGRPSAFRLPPLNGPEERPRRRGEDRSGDARSSRKGSDEKRCVTACNLASASSLAEITGSSFPRSLRSPLVTLSALSLSFSPSLSLTQSLSGDFATSRLELRRTKLRFRVGDIIKPASTSASSILGPRIIVDQGNRILNARLLCEVRAVPADFNAAIAPRYRPQ